MKPSPAQRVFLICALVVVAGCASAPHPIANHPLPLTATIPPPTATSSPSPTATPQPTATPIPLPGWYPVTSSSWSGYSVPQGQITGVRAQWRQPDISGVPNANVYMWIGVGGWGDTFQELVQIGTLAYLNPDGATRNNVVWYETLPQNNHLTTVYVNPGDDISATMTLAPGSARDWTLTLTDLTSGQNFAIKLTYPSSQIYADFIVEDPATSATPGAAKYPFAHFAPETFTNAEVRYGAQWVPLAELRAMQVTLVQSGQTLARPGPLSGLTSFTVTRVGS